ncbi:unnamed protein product, partial [Larinioides sclopetarius]
MCFSDSGGSKTWRFVKISSSNFLTITILSLYEKVKIVKKRNVERSTPKSNQYQFMLKYN